MILEGPWFQTATPFNPGSLLRCTAGAPRGPGRSVFVLFHCLGNSLSNNHEQGYRYANTVEHFAVLVRDAACSPCSRAAAFGSIQNAC
jgi:hypothetical protein